MMKRLFDILFSFCGLVLLFPLIGVLALQVRRKIGSPVLFRQTRPGLNGRPFEMVKFRTMKDVVDGNTRHAAHAVKRRNVSRSIRRAVSGPAETRLRFVTDVRRHTTELPTVGNSLRNYRSSGRPAVSNKSGVEVENVHLVRGGSRQIASRSDANPEELLQVGIDPVISVQRNRTGHRSNVCRCCILQRPDWCVSLSVGILTRVRNTRKNRLVNQPLRHFIRSAGGRPSTSIAQPKVSTEHSKGGRGRGGQ